MLIFIDTKSYSIIRQKKHYMKIQGKNITKTYQICSNCVMDTSDSKIIFDEAGVCNHCIDFNKNIAPEWKSNLKDNAKLEMITEQIRRSGKGKEYDCILT